MLKKSPSVDYLEYFPQDSTPRPQQIKALEKISNIFSCGKKYVIACLPTGSGKSHIAASIARSAKPIDDHRRNLIEEYLIYKKDANGDYVYENDFLSEDAFGSFILTVTKSLQDQYLSLFEEMISVKGKSNYQCVVDTDATAEYAPCSYDKKTKQKCFDFKHCPYYEKRKQALLIADPVLNYRSFFALVPFLRKREYYICDEAGQLEDELVGQYSVTIFYSQLKAENISFNKLISDDSKKAGEWLKNIYEQLFDEKTKLLESIRNSAKDKNFAGMKIKQTQRLNKLTNLVSSLQVAINYWEEAEFLVEFKDSEKVVLVPYDIRPFARDIFSGADKVLLMSATITNPEEYAKSLGIKPEEYEYIEVGSAFDAKKSPIMCSSQYNLSYATIDRDLPKVIKTAIEICNQNKGKKGLIHTHTNKITQEFKRMVGKDKRFLFRDSGFSNEDILKEHKDRDDDTILVSPSLDTGVSLDDNLGRFQIVLKAPFLPLSSKRVKKIFDKNKKYYTMKMLDTLVQMCGRCTRSEDDHSTTYILDGVVHRNILDNHNKLPKHFIDRFI
jgi:ATP-dependent DNA helicase DinG